MNRRNLITFATWTFATFAIASAGMMWTSLEATQDQATKPAQPPAPVLKSGPAEITLTLAPDTHLAPGEIPVFIVEARNTSSEAITIPATITILGTAPTSPMMRAMPRPTQVWQRKLDIALSPNGTQTIRISPDNIGSQAKLTQAAPSNIAAAANVLPQQSLTVTLASGKQQIVALHSEVPPLDIAKQLRAVPKNINGKLATGN